MPLFISFSFFLFLPLSFPQFLSFFLSFTHLNWSHSLLIWYKLQGGKLFEKNIPSTPFWTLSIHYGSKLFLILYSCVSTFYLPCHSVFIIICTFLNISIERHKEKVLRRRKNREETRKKKREWKYNPGRCQREMVVGYCHYSSFHRPVVLHSFIRWEEREEASFICQV